MSGSVGVIADATGRYTEFTNSLVQLRSPVNTQLMFQIGSDRGRSRNTLVQRSLEIGSEWILFLDDDHSFAPDLLTQLLSRNQPIVASLYLQRVDPFYPIAYDTKKDDGYYLPVDLREHEPNALVPIVAAGTGGMLIRTEVFDALPAPWFLHTTEQSEDLYFCDRAREAGIPMFVDLAARLGHLTAVNVVPIYDDEHGWTAGMPISGSYTSLHRIGYQ